jgi:hypothetical protein
VSGSANQALEPYAWWASEKHESPQDIEHCEPLGSTYSFGVMRTRTRIWAVVALVLAAIAIGALLFAIGPGRKLGEFSRAEAVKGYWASLQEFEKQKGRYPRDDAEIAAFFHTAPGAEQVEYVPPQQSSGDEVILWWRQKTLFGVQVGITKAGTIVKR